ncbi:HRDC domain-containing protein [Formosa sp. 3Alg 14/1]|uniref:HRDC domain-containing protein n=1 Tax=unclassified Formosa TaxID=2644710 RepID=UPI0039BE8909
MSDDDVKLTKALKPFWILRNSSLLDMVTMKPTASNQLLEIKGISTKTVENYDKAIISILGQYKE